MISTRRAASADAWAGLDLLAAPRPWPPMAAASPAKFRRESRAGRSAYRQTDTFTRRGIPQGGGKSHAGLAELPEQEADLRSSPPRAFHFSAILYLSPGFLRRNLLESPTEAKIRQNKTKTHKPPDKRSINGAPAQGVSVCCCFSSHLTH